MRALLVLAGAGLYALALPPFDCSSLAWLTLVPLLLVVRGLRARQAFKAGNEVRLTRKEFDLLRYLIEHRSEVITRDRLLDEVWGYERFPTTRTVDAHILRLRQKFEPEPEHPVYILTVHGQGYRFVG